METNLRESLRTLQADADLIHFEGERSCADMIMKSIGADAKALLIDDEDAVYERYSILKYLDFFAGLCKAKGQLPSVIEQMHLEKIQKKKLRDCSYGEKRRVVVARELLRECDVYVMLNPLENIDRDSQKMILDWMESFHGSGRKLITISQSHRYTCICPGAHYEISEDTVVCIDQNEVTEENPELPVINKISVTYQEKTFLFNPEEIDYVEANDGQVFVYVQKERYTGAYKMGELEERLGKFGFFRCHRSYIVNMQKVVELVKWTRNSYSLKLAKYEKTDIPLSKAKIQELKSMYEF